MKKWETGVKDIFTGNIHSPPHMQQKHDVNVNVNVNDPGKHVSNVQTTSKTTRTSTNLGRNMPMSTLLGI